MADSIQSAHDICKKLSNDYGVECTNQDTVKKCYQKLSMKLHPDKHPLEPDKYTHLFQELLTTYKKCEKDYENTPCNNVHEPKLRPRTNPTRGPPSPQSQPRPQEQDPYREAYEKTTSEVPKGATFQEFKTRFIANLIPLATKTCLAVVAFGIVYVKVISGNSVMPPGLNFGRGGTKKRKTLNGGGPGRQGKTTNLPNPNTSRILAAENSKYFLNRGTTPRGNASSMLNSARGNYYNDFEITKRWIPGAKSESGVGLADMNFDLPLQENRHTRRRVTRGSMEVSQPLAVMLLVSLMLIPAVSAQSVDDISSLGNEVATQAVDNSAADMKTRIAPFVFEKQNALAGMADNSYYELAKELFSGKDATGNLQRFCAENGVPKDSCSISEINKQVAEFKQMVSQLPGVFRNAFSKVVTPGYQTSKCTRFGKPAGFKEEQVVLRKGVFKDTYGTVEVEQFEDCAYRISDVVSVTFDDMNNPVLTINSEKLVHNMKELEKFLPKYCPGPDIRVIVPKYERTSNLQKFMQTLFEKFNVNDLNSMNPASVYNQCMIGRITQDIFETVFTLLHEQQISKTDITSAAFSELFNLLEVAVNPKAFLFESTEKMDKFNEAVLAAANSKTWSGMALNAAKDVGNLAGSAVAGTVFGIFEPFYDRRSIYAMGSLVGVCFVFSICARLLNPIAIATSKLPSLPALPALPSSFNPLATPVNSPLAIQPPANPPANPPPPPLAIQPPANPLAIQYAQTGGRRNRRSKRNSHKNAAHKKRKGTSSRYRSHKHK
jgi:hypothetical protein